MVLHQLLIFSLVHLSQFYVSPVNIIFRHNVIPALILVKKKRQAELISV